MEGNEWFELAALAALGILDTEGAQIVQEAIALDPVLQAELTDFEQVVAALPYAAPLVPLPPSLKANLFQRIATEVTPPPVTELKQRALTADWQSIAQSPGMAISMITTNPDTRIVTCFVRATEQMRFPTHRHASSEEIIVLAGDLIVNGQSYQPGDTIYSVANSIHTPETSTGCLLYLSTSLDDEILDPVD